MAGLVVAFGTHLELGLEDFDDVYEGLEIEQHGVKFSVLLRPQPIASAGRVPQRLDDDASRVAGRQFKPVPLFLRGQFGDQSVMGP